MNGGSIARRQVWLRQFAAGVRSRHAELCAVVESEIGKPAWETTLAEILPLTASLDWQRRHLRSILGARAVRGGAWWQLGDRVRTERHALGRVIIIATWNYPLQLLGIQLAQSIAAGNETWVKPSERAPRAHAALLAIARAALRDAGLPEELLVECEASAEEGERLVREVSTDHIVFTGSTRVGRLIAQAAASTLTPTTLELSGHDSAIVLGDADHRLASRSIWNAVVMNAGQTCMAPRRVLVEASAYRGFLEALAPLTAAANPLQLIDEAAATRTAEIVIDAIHRGGRPLSGVVEPPRGRWLRAAAIVDCPEDAPLVEGDHFGPALAVLPVRDLVDAIRVHRNSGQALATSVFTSTPDRVRARAAEFGSSFLTINDCVRPTAHPATAITGRGASGWGSSRGRSGLLAMSREVTVTQRGVCSAPADIPSPTVVRWISRLAGLRPRDGGGADRTNGATQ